MNTSKLYELVWWTRAVPVYTTRNLAYICIRRNNHFYVNLNLVSFLESKGVYSFISYVEMLRADHYLFRIWVNGINDFINLIERYETKAFLCQDCVYAPESMLIRRLTLFPYSFLHIKGIYQNATLFTQRYNTREFDKGIMGFKSCRYARRSSSHISTRRFVGSTRAYSSTALSARRRR